MTVGSILLGLALLLLVGLFIARPLLQPEVRHVRVRTPRQQLIEQKETVLGQILALDFDVETGKVPVELHQPQRQALLAQAAHLLEQLDQLPADEAVEAAIETAVTKLRTVTPPPPVAAAPPPPNDGSPRFCSQCGQPVAAGDKFCAYCGQPLRLADVSPSV